MYVVGQELNMRPHPAYLISTSLIVRDHYVNTFSMESNQNFCSFTSY